MTPLKILLIIPQYDVIGGAETQAKWLAEELVNQGHEVHLITSSHEKLPKISKENGVIVHRVINNPRVLSLTTFITIYKVFKYVKKIDPDVIHAFFAYPTGIWCLPSKYLLNKPLIISARGGDIQIKPEINYGIRLNPIKAFLVKIVLKWCDKVTVLGEGMVKDALDAGAPKEKIEIIYNAIKDSEDNIDKNLINEIYRKYNLPKDKRILLFLSRISPEKGINYLIDAFENLEKLYPDLILVFAGSGTELQNVKKIVNRKNLYEKIKVIGPVFGREKRALFKISDIFILPSLSEGIPTVLLEAMLYSKPIVSTNITGVNEIIENGKSGILVPPANSKALEEAISKLLHEQRLREKLATNARKRAELFSINKIAKKYVELYRNLIRIDKHQTATLLSFLSKKP